MPIFTLPPATFGRHFDFVEGFAGRAGQTTIIVPQPGETIMIAGTIVTQIEGSDLQANAEGFSYISFVCLIDGLWKTRTVEGTWILIP